MQYPTLNLRNLARPLLPWLALLLALASAPAWAGEADRLDVADVLQVSIFGEPDLSGKFTVGPDGAISFPPLGRVAVRDLTPEETARRLADGLTGRIPAEHSVTVDVIGHAPVFVTGDVQTPGRYEYRPGMLVLELVALGGGLRRPLAPQTGAALQLLTLRQEHADQRLVQVSQRVERQRIEAEIAGTAFDMAGLSQSGAPADMVAAEAALFEIRKAAFASQMAAFDAQRGTIDDEIRTLLENLTLHDQELDLIAQDVAASQQLADQGLTARSRLRESQRQHTALNRDKLDVMSFLARARQNRLDVDQRSGSLRDARASENALALRILELAIVRTDQKIASLAASIGAASDDLEVGSVRQVPAATYLVIRRKASSIVRIAVSDTDPLRPGDILEVDRHLAEFDGFQMSQTR